jgi:1-acyl-sn-glycerol-3-phosphate acyltransferase
MILLRSLLYFTFLVISTTLFGLTLATLGWLLPFSGRSRIANLWSLTNLKLQKLVCNLDYQVTGLENIPTGNAIVLSKHQSAWETIALRCILPPEQTWVLKQELMWIPIFGWALAAVQPIAINRKAGRQAAGQIIKQGRRLLQLGRTVVVFPEGTRVAPGTRKKYGIGGALLAEKTGYPVVPIAHNAGVFWRRRGLKKLPGTIQVVIGPLIEVKGLSAIEINRRAEQWIETTVSALPQHYSV